MGSSNSRGAASGILSARFMARVISVYLVYLVVTALAVGAAACGGPDADREAKPAPTVTTPARAEPDLHGFTFPIVGGCLPTSDRLIPNAPRTYRNGVHEGVDFYHSDNCTPITRGTEVVAAKAGRVIRADLSYVDLTAETVEAYLKNPNTEASIDQFRGRQVWIDHGADVVTRYCHLSGIAPGIATGKTVAAGELIAFVGESGTPTSTRKPGTEYHLHFEVRVGDSYLGKGLPAPEVRSLYRELFGVAVK
jgi:murein DD-endopeptidase MepM/ murein hydrolase activator NlpD